MWPKIIIYDITNKKDYLRLGIKDQEYISKCNELKDGVYVGYSYYPNHHINILDTKNRTKKQEMADRK